MTEMPLFSLEKKKSEEERDSLQVRSRSEKELNSVVSVLNTKSDL